MTYFDRASWGARAPKSTPVRMNPANVTTTYIHYTAGPKTQKVRAIQDFHMDTRQWSDIAYSFLVDDAGNVYEGRGWLVVGGHTKNQNSVSHAICWIGTEGEPSDSALRSINQLISEAEARVGHALMVKPHSAAPGAATSCPGDALRRWIANGRPTTTTAPAENGDEPEMNENERTQLNNMETVGKNTEAAVKFTEARIIALDKWIKQAMAADAALTLSDGDIKVIVDALLLETARRFTQAAK